MEGELFGYEAGAFTGATGDRRGYFGLTYGGTIFLDEIGELPRHLQVKLLRVLQERTIQPLGGEKSIAINVLLLHCFRHIGMALALLLSGVTATAVEQTRFAWATSSILARGRIEPSSAPVHGASWQ